ncbi:Ser/Thr protein phosphatase family protein [Myxococcus xanthus DK 1622]|uniref:Ser/Thr protein phosphatase family protein n=2 Tax=Myxococcus xanthus TaxID=34 RepID=Q1CZD3_MYXXD|nr:MULTISPECIES: metallophosphoesterase [Myxococcus]AAL60238.1 putative phosphoesterase [Myxococcus xanthus]ABF93048.1 Ser/Thr protein phosphatase family protein [Myxococcus xanthus DK 1622]NOJ57460.1 metallophosphoesterase [Myxococcus xanthus]QDE92651.1 metallophosphoesterase [Myxococcus xanthus]QPM78501.1 metallophosphoesterase [Myxococcus xanthus]
MKLYAISDLHLRHNDNRLALQALPAHPEDWLIVAGDVGETLAEMELMLSTLTQRFRQVIWVPGNHELWTMPSEQPQLKGEARYQRLVSLCRSYGALTPEDPYPRWPGPGPERVIVPMFLGYDYTFRPDHVPADKALEWAWEDDLLCTDEVLLHPEPHASRAAWCAARVEATRARLDALPPGCATVLVNHYPLRYEHVRLPRIPRFSIWCGTKQTEDWHTRYRAEVVVSGHLHMPATLWRDGVRFEEVSLGYPVQWKYRGVHAWESCLRVILPGPTP